MSLHFFHSYHAKRLSWFIKYFFDFTAPQKARTRATAMGDYGPETEPKDLTPIVEYG